MFGLQNLKYRKTTAKDDIVTGILKDLGKKFDRELAELFTHCIRKQRVPENFCLQYSNLTL